MSRRLDVLTFQPRHDDSAEREAARIVRRLTPRRQQVALHLLRLSLMNQNHDRDERKGA